MKQLLTFSEFNQRADTVDKTQIERFNKFYVTAEETYLADFMGAELVVKFKDGTYTDADTLSLIKKCLTHQIELMFVNHGDSISTSIGLVQRESEYSKPAEYAKVKLKIEAVLKILRSYEKQLLPLIADLTEYDGAVKPISNNNIPYLFTSIGD